MSKLPVVSGGETIRVLMRIGYEVVRKKGSHVRLRCADDSSRGPVTVPDHRTLKPGTLRAILRDAKLSVDEYIELLSS
jgi:predicted RNA binding protein YcfA (HicA-like mRNA interferase family)